jgi:adenine specific DNA methylase Mod
VGNVVTENMRIAGCNKDGKYFGKGQKDYKPSKAENPSDAKRRILESMSKVKKVIGYKECDCKAGFEAGTVLDPFFGAGTVAIVAEEQRLNWIGIELKKEYADIATERLKPYMEQEKL